MINPQNMKKIVLFILMMLPVAVFGQENGKSFMEESLEKLKGLQPAQQQIFLDVIKNSKIDTLGLCYTLPNGEIVEAFFEQQESISTFWKSIFRYNQVKEICNVPFGSSYEEAKRVLTDKFGDYDYLNSTKDHLRFKNKKYAGMDFNAIHFLFQSDGENSYFNAAIFCIDCKSKNEAIRQKDWMHKRLSERYSVFVNMDGDGEYLSMGGLPPVATEANFGFGVHIDVIDYGENGKTLGCPFGVRIVYGPYDYVKEEF